MRDVDDRAFIAFSVRQRWLVVLLVAARLPHSAPGRSQRLPIDAVPDITNNQVQINAIAPALSPIEIEKQVTFPIETALAGIPGLEYTRSLSRNGFSQVTAVFAEKIDIYFARQQVNERLAEAQGDFPPRRRGAHGADRDRPRRNLHVDGRLRRRRGRKIAMDGEPGWQSDGTYLTPEGERAAQRGRARPPICARCRTGSSGRSSKTVPGVAGVDSLGGYVKQYQVQPDPAKLIALGLSFADRRGAIERNNVSRGAGYIERNGEGYVVRSGGRLETIDDIARRRRGDARRRAGAGHGRRRGRRSARELRTGSASVNGEEVVIGTALMLIGGNSRTVVGGGRRQDRSEIGASLPPGIEVDDRSSTAPCSSTPPSSTVAKNLAEGALLVILVLFLLLGNFRAALITALVIPVDHAADRRPAWCRAASAPI